jgi:hypothetical protein
MKSETITQTLTEIVKSKKHSCFACHLAASFSIHVSDTFRNFLIAKGFFNSDILLSWNIASGILPFHKGTPKQHREQLEILCNAILQQQFHRYQFTLFDLTGEMIQ